MIRRNTWILIVLLLALIGFAFYLKNRKAQVAAAATPTAASGLASSAPVFSASLGAPTEINVKDTTGNTVDIVRNSSGTWVLKAPIDTQASQAAAEAAATQVTALRVISGVQLGFDVVGLDKPSYIMTFKFTDGSSHTLNVGALTPLQDGYYTSLDGGTVKIVDKPGLDALIQLLAQPPYLATPTIPATATAAATLAPTQTPTLAVTGTSVPAATSTPAATGSAAPTSTATP